MAVVGRRRRFVGVAALCALALLVAAWSPLTRHLRAAQLLLGWQDAHEPVGGVTARDVRIAGAPARLYEAPSGGAPVVLVHGVHVAGIDEPRLVRFARLLADAGFSVLTPSLPALSELTLDPAAPAQIADACAAFAQDHGVPSVGVIGISVGGGLSLLAAAERPEAIHAVWAIGAHHDLSRLVAWWSGGDAPGPGGEPPGAEPEAYGAQVLAYAFAEDFFAPEDVAAGRLVLRARIEEEHARARAMREDASPSVRARLDAVREPGEAVLALAERRRADLEALSPRGRLEPVTARVWLLAGRGDPVVASTESLHLARELGHRADGLLRTGLLGHASARDDATLGDRLELVHHAAGALAALEQ